MSSYWPPGKHPKRGLLISLVVLVGFGSLAFYLSSQAGQDATKPQPAPVVAAPVITQSSPSTPSRAAVAVPRKPLLPTDRLRPQLADALPPGDLFAQESRDEVWAAATDAEIAKRLSQLRGGTIAVLCHQTVCRIELAGTTHDLSLAMPDLQKALVGFAESMTLTAPETRADGTLKMRAYLTFVR